MNNIQRFNYKGFDIWHYTVYNIYQIRGTTTSIELEGKTKDQVELFIDTLIEYREMLS